MYNQRNKDSLFWLIFFIIIIAPFAMLSSNKEVDEVDKRRRLSNKIGLFVLFTIIVGAIGTRLIYNAVDKQNASKSTEILSEVAQGFANHDSEVIMSWARGDIKDAWENTLVLVSNDETGIILVSKGKDGQFGTKDDLQYSVAWTPKPVPQSPLRPESPKKKTIGQKIRGLFGGK